MREALERVFAFRTALNLDSLILVPFATRTTSAILKLMYVNGSRHVIRVFGSFISLFERSM